MSGTEDIAKQIDYLARALKAPRIREAATRLAGQARDAGWTHEEYFAAVLDREVSARDASGAQLRTQRRGVRVTENLTTTSANSRASAESLRHRLELAHQQITRLRTEARQISEALAEPTANSAPKNSYPDERTTLS